MQLILGKARRMRGGAAKTAIRSRRQTTADSIVSRRTVYTLRITHPLFTAFTLTPR